MEIQDSQNAWRQFEITGSVADYLRYRSVLEPSGTAGLAPGEVREGGNAFESKGAGFEKPPNW